MTRTAPLRLITLQLRQIFFTDALTFMVVSVILSRCAERGETILNSAAAVVAQFRLFH